MTKNEFKDIADRSEQELEKLKKTLDEVRTKLKDSDIPALKTRAVTLFSGLCDLPPKKWTGLSCF